MIVDGVNILEAFGITVLEGGYNGFVSFPSLKEPQKTDWAELDGIEVDLSDPKLNSKTFSMHFYGKQINAFIDLLSDGAYHNFTCIGVTRILRMVSFGELNWNIFSIQFADDYPLSGYAYLGPGSTLISQRGYELDGIDLSTYGVAILEGSDDEIKKKPAVKQNLTVNVRSENGLIYDPQNVKFKEKEVRLKCLMLANNLNDFWRNYNALLFDLSRPGLRTFSFDAVEYPCYYRSSSVSKFIPEGRIWCRFDLDLVFTKLGTAV